MKAILIDDEILALDFLKRQIEKVSDVDIIGKFTYIDVDNEIKLLKETHVAFLDIEMPGINGLELAELILEINPNMSIVFVTAYGEYAVHAFQLNAVDYLIKPVQQERLQDTIDRIKVQQKLAVLQPVPVSNILYIHNFRELSFTINDKVELVQWRTNKTRELFLFLLKNNGKTIQKDQLVELLWPDFDVERGYSQLYTAIYHLRKTARKFSDHLSIKNMTDGYILMKRNVVIDFLEWEEEINSLEEINENNSKDYEKVLNLYTGAYLEAYDFSWAESAQYRLEQLWIETAYTLADYYVNNNLLDQAVDWFAKICELRTDEENAQFSLMKLYAKLGYGILVTHQYKQLKEALDELGAPMNDAIDDWYNKWEDEVYL